MKSRFVLSLFLIIYFTILPTHAQDAALTPLPALEPITVNNVAHVEQIARFGSGILSGSMSWSPDGKTLAVAGSIGIWLYNPDDWNAAPRLIDSGQPPSSMAFSRDGKWLGYGDSDAIHLLDAVSLQEVKRFDDDSVFAFSPDSKMMAIEHTVFGGNYFDTQIQLWKMPEQSLLTSIDEGFSSLRQLSFSPDGRLLSAAMSSIADTTCDNRTTQVDVWDVNELLKPNSESVIKESITDSQFVTFSPDSSLIATVAQSYLDGDTSAIRLWDVEANKQLYLLSNADVVDLHSKDSSPEWLSVSDMAFSPDHESFAAAVNGAEHHFLRLWDVHTGAEYLDIWLDTAVDSISFSPTGAEIIGVSKNTLYVWEVGETVNQTAAVPLANSMADMTLSPTGSAFTFRDTAGFLHLWSSDGVERHVSQTPLMPQNLAFDRQGNKVIFTDDHTLTIWDVKFSREMTLEKDQDAPFSLSADGSLLALWKDDRVEMWDTDQQEVKSTLNNNFAKDVHLMFNLYGTQLLSIASDESNKRSIQLWDVMTGNLVRDFGTYDGSIEAHFDQNGSRVAITHIKPANLSQDDDQTWIVDIQAGKQVFSFFGANAGTGILTPDWKSYIVNEGDYSSTDLRFIDVATGKDVYDQPVSPSFSAFGSGNVIGFSPDGTKMIVYMSSFTNCGGDFRGLDLWDMKEQKWAASIGLYSSPPRGGPGIIFSSDGALLMIADVYRVSFYNAQDGTRLGYLGQYSMNNPHMSMNSEGTLLMTSGDDGTIRLWGVPKP